VVTNVSAMKKLLIAILSITGLLALLYAGGPCRDLSEDEVVEFARGQITKEIDFLVRHFGEPATEVQAGRFVLFYWLDNFYQYSVMYQTPRGQLVDMERSVTCNVRWSYPARIGPREDAVFTRDLRTGKPFFERSTVTKGILSVPGTEASHSGAIQSPREAIR
jgi:hypothetical protein